VDEYTKTYISLIEHGRFCNWLPWGAKCRIGSWFGRNRSFLLLRRQQIVDSMQACLGASQAEADGHFRLLCESSGVAMQMVRQLADISTTWLERHIQVPDQKLLEEIRQTGGVILSHHSYHHNLLISFFKVCGLPAFPVGNPPTAFSEDDYLYRFTLQLNQATATNLSGGNWLYNNRGRDFLLGLRQALEPRKIVLLFCDFNEAKKSNPIVPFLGKTLQIPNGVLRLVDKEPIPVYFAGFRRQPPDNYTMSLTRLQTQAINPQVAPLGEQYLQALEQHVRQHPSAWQCWEAF
jgi:lauroyl/myristoyl acyltransferase